MSEEGVWCHAVTQYSWANRKMSQQITCSGHLHMNEDSLNVSKKLYSIFSCQSFPNVARSIN